MLEDAANEHIALAAFAKAAARLAAQEAAAHNAVERADIEIIADKAVRSAFLAFGLDPLDKASTSEFLLTMQELRSWRRTRGWIYEGGLKAVAASLFVAILWALWRLALRAQP